MSLFNVVPVAVIVIASTRSKYLLRTYLPTYLPMYLPMYLPTS